MKVIFYITKAILLIKHLLNKKIYIYVSISYFNKKTKNDIIKIIDPEKSLKFYVKNNTLKDSLIFQLTNINGQIPQLRESKIYNFHYQG